MPTEGCCRVLPFFTIEKVPQLTALAASVYATMLFPDDSQRLDRYACAQAICLDWRVRFEKGEIEEVLPVVRGELFTVLDFTRRIPFEKLISLKNEAASAAHVLKFALLLDIDTNTTSSVRKAMALTLKYVPVSER